MAQLSQIEQLEAHRQRLVEESARYRQELAGAAAELRSAATWVEAGYSLVRSIGIYVPLIAAVAGLFGGRRKGSLLRLLGRGWSLWRLGRKVAGLWARERNGH